MKLKELKEDAEVLRIAKYGLEIEKLKLEISVLKKTNKLFDKTNKFFDKLSELEKLFDDEKSDCKSEPNAAVKETEEAAAKEASEKFGAMVARFNKFNVKDFKDMVRAIGEMIEHDNAEIELLARKCNSENSNSEKPEVKNGR